jgi:hypothetical protein
MQQLGRNTYEVLVGKPEGKRQLERHGWEDNIKMEIDCDRCGLD